MSQRAGRSPVRARVGEPIHARNGHRTAGAHFFTHRSRKQRSFLALHAHPLAVKANLADELPQVALGEAAEPIQEPRPHRRRKAFQPTRIEQCQGHLLCALRPSDLQHDSLAPRLELLHAGAQHVIHRQHPLLDGLIEAIGGSF